VGKQDNLLDRISKPLYYYCLKLCKKSSTNGQVLA